MRKISFLLLICLILNFIPLFSQKQIDPNDTLDNTIILKHYYKINEDFADFTKFIPYGVTYKITFRGRYHIWPFYNPSYGLDALYFQDVPVYKSNNPQRDRERQEYVNTIFSKKIPLTSKDLIRIPSPFGNSDDSVFFIPIRDVGLRINNQVISNFQLEYSDTTKNLYQIIIKGDNKNYNFKFLRTIHFPDGTSILSEQKGDFAIFIRQIVGSDTCRTSVRKRDKEIEIQIDFAELIADTTLLKGVRNLLKTKSLLEQEKHFVLRSKGLFYCIDSIDCLVPIKNKKVLLLVDNSNSMNQSVGSGQIDKIVLEKDLVKAFIDNTVNPTDSLALITFNTNYELTHWTNDKQLIKSKVDSLKPGGNTLLYKYLLKSLEYLALNPNKNKILVVFSDGFNQPPNYDPTSTFEYLISNISKFSDIPIYFVVIPSNPGRDRDIAIKRLFTIKNTHKNSTIIFTPDDFAQAVNSIQKISEEISTELCCSIFLNIPNPCTRSDEIVYLDLFYSPVEFDTVLVYKIPINCKDILMNYSYSCLRIVPASIPLVYQSGKFYGKYYFINLGNEPISISNFATRYTKFSTSKRLPLLIPPYDSIGVDFIFEPEISNSFDTLIVFKNTPCGDSTISINFKDVTLNYDAGEIFSNSPNDSSPYLIVYPNPVSGEAFVGVNLLVEQFDNIHINLLEHNGFLLHTESFVADHSGIYDLKISTENLSSGVYFLLLKINGRNVLKPFVVLK